jgi:CRP-like cAMP-binding protein
VETGLKQLTVIRPGECFGELALIANMPRAAGVICREDTHLAVLDRGEYYRILAKVQDQQLRKKVELLQRHPIFVRWTKSAVQRLSYFFKLKQYKRKQAVFTASAPATSVFIVKSGEFQLLRDLEASSKPAIEVALVSAGEILGARELMASEGLFYHCVCNSALGEVLVITKDDFLHALNEDTIESLLRMDREKEKHRAERWVSALKLRESKPKPPKYRTEQSTLDVSTSLLLRKELVRGKSMYDAFPVGLNSPTQAEISPLRLGNFSIRPTRVSKKVHVPASHSWSEIFLSKYSLHPARSKKHPISYLPALEIKSSARKLQATQGASRATPRTNPLISSKLAS